MADVKVQMRLSVREADVIRVALEHLMAEAKAGNGFDPKEVVNIGHYAPRILVALDDFRNTVPPKLTWENKPE